MSFLFPWNPMAPALLGPFLSGSQAAPQEPEPPLGGEGEGGPGDEELSTSLALQQKLQEVQG